MGKCPTTCPECGANLGGAGKKSSKRAVVPDIPDDDDHMDDVAPVRKPRKKSKKSRKVGPDLGTNPIYGSLRWV